MLFLDSLYESSLIEYQRCRDYFILEGDRIETQEKTETPFFEG